MASLGRFIDSSGSLFFILSYVISPVLSTNLVSARGSGYDGWGTGTGTGKDFRLPGVPNPPDPPSFIGSPQGYMGMNPFMNTWSPFFNNGGNSGYLAGQNGGGNNFQQGGGYGSSYGQSPAGNPPSTSYNNNAKGTNANGYRPQQPPQQRPSTSNNGPMSYAPAGNYNRQNANGAGQSSYAANAQNPGTGFPADRSCRPSGRPNTVGFCVPRNQVMNRCQDMGASYSSDCGSKEECCFGAGPFNAPPTTVAATAPPTTTTTSTTTTPSTTTPAPTTATTPQPTTTTMTTTLNPDERVRREKVPESPLSADRFCLPDDEEGVSGVCVAVESLGNFCEGKSVSTSTNCNFDEGCCYASADPAAIEGAAAKTESTTAQTTTTTKAVKLESPNESARGSAQKSASKEETLPPFVPASVTPAAVRMTTTTEKPFVPPNAKRCRPGSFPSVTNGFCSSIFNVGQNCKGKQISPSIDCDNKQDFCCFTADSATGGFKQAACVPSQEPSVRNGLCVEESRLTFECKGKLMSTSKNCDDRQFCCYDASAVPSKAKQSPVVTATVRTTTTTTTPATTTVPPTVCRPGSWPYKNPNGTCVVRNQINQQCKGYQIDYSLDCGFQEFCCFLKGNSTVEENPKTVAAAGKCVPSSAPSVKDGFCTGTTQLAKRCSGMEVSPSSNCASTELCCFWPQSSEESTAATTTSVRPSVATTRAAAATTRAPTTASTTSLSTTETSTNTAPTTSASTTAASSSDVLCNPERYRQLTGVCREADSLMETCAGIQIDLSLNCTESQYCCFSNIEQAASVLTKSNPQGSGCTPDGNPSVSDGTCVDMTAVADQCQGIEMSTTKDCGATDFCCYTTPSTASTASPTATTAFLTSTRSPSTARTPASMNAAAVEGAASVTVEKEVISNKQIVSPSISDQKLVNCVPQSAPNVTNGICVEVGELGMRCRGRRVSRSQQCGDAFCCFVADFVLGNVAPTAATTTATTTTTTPATTTTVPIDVEAPECMPNSAPDATDGICVSVSEMGVKCRGRRASKSAQCGNGFCCFTEGLVAKSERVPGSDSAATPTTTPATTLATTVKPVSTETVECIPNSAPDAIDGFCVTIPELSLKCRDRKAAKSPQCSQGLCCFKESPAAKSGKLPHKENAAESTTTTPVASVVSTNQQPVPIVAADRTCLPADVLGATEGVCVPLNQLSTRCSGKRISKVVQCGEDFCCYDTTKVETKVVVDSEAAVSADETCSPTDAAHAAQGICVPASQLGARCKGKRVSKSPQCSKGLCCYDSATTTSAPVTKSALNLEQPIKNQVVESAQKQTSQQRVCTPLNTADAAEGFCATLAELTSKCAGRRMSKADECGNDFCCYETVRDVAQTKNSNSGTALKVEAAETTIRLTTAATTPTTTLATAPKRDQSCSPMDSSDMRGVCVASSDLTKRCKSKRVVKAPECPANEFCCFDSPPPALDKILEPTTTASTTTMTTTTLATSTTTPTRDHSCSPMDSPDIKGLCVARSDLTNRCRSKRVVKAPECPENEFCCFDSPPPVFDKILDPTTTATTTTTTTTTQVPDVRCSPVTDRNIHDGICVKKNDLQFKCRGKRVSAADQCGKDFCCFEGFDPHRLKQATEPPTTTEATTVPTTTRSPLCRPKTEPTFSNGTCVMLPDLRATCKGHRISQSADCPPLSFCCFTTGVESVAAPEVPTTVQQFDIGSHDGGRKQQTGPVSCTPKTDPSVNDGTCFTSAELRGSCKGMRIAKSNNCSDSDYCCFRGAQSVMSEPKKKIEERSCSPTTQPTFTNGKCIALNDLSERCRQLTVSASGDCPERHWCCFKPMENIRIQQTPAPTVSVSDNKAPTVTENVSANKQERPVSCTPRTDSTATGECVNLERISSVCGNKMMAKSDQCAGRQVCCFDRAPVQVQVKSTAAASCSPISNPEIRNGSCVPIDSVEQACSRQRMSRSANCGTNQLCCFDAPRSTAGECSPNTAPGITDGICVPLEGLKDQCGALQIASSDQCRPLFGQRQLCCFKQSSVKLAAFSEEIKTVKCTPFSDPKASGQCVHLRELERSCRGKTLSRSSACAGSEMCCFDPRMEEVTIKNKPPGGDCIPNSDISATPGKCVAMDQLKDTCKGQMSRSQNCSSSELCCFDRFVRENAAAVVKEQSVLVSLAPVACSPNSQPDVKNGLCVHKSEIGSKCGGRRMSRSSACAEDSLCCFDTPNDFGPLSINKLATGSCSPITAPEVTDGKCSLIASLSSKCSGGEVASSENCQDGMELCCFKRPDSTKGSVFIGPEDTSIRPSCSPKTRSDIKNGKCTPMSVLNTECGGKQLAASTDCLAGQLCCFEAKEAPSVKAVSKSCRPSTDLFTANGVCVGLAELKGQCTEHVSSSADCSRGQLCCFHRDESLKSVPTPSLENLVTPAPIIVRPPAVIPEKCAPFTQPGITDGFCTSLLELNVKCAGLDVARAEACSKTNALCCFKRPLSVSLETPTEATTSTTTTTTERRRPLAPVAIPMETSTEATTTTMKRSNRPLPPAFIPALAEESGRCSPSSAPEIKDGNCVPMMELREKCFGMEAAKSADCRSSSSLCCFKRPLLEPLGIETLTEATTTTQSPSTDATTTAATTSASTTMALVTPASMKVQKEETSSGIRVACSPVTAPEISNGSCVALTSLQEQCAGMEIASSKDCEKVAGNRNLCCFKRSDISKAAFGIETPAPPGFCSPNSQPVIRDGKCVQLEDLNSKCSGQRLSASSNCASGQFCCFSEESSKKALSKECHPLTSSDVKGSCTAVESLEGSCASKQVAGSTDCSRNELCCFERISTPSPVIVSSQTASCSPVTAPEVSNGTCVAIDSLQAVCSEMEIASGDSCTRSSGRSSLCCFNRPNKFQDAVTLSKLSAKGALCSPKTVPSVTDGRCLPVNELASECTGNDRRMSTSDNCEKGHFCCFSEKPEKKFAPVTCTPASDSISGQGTCVAIDNLKDSCKAQISGSLNCSRGELCCFERKDISTEEVQQPVEKVVIPAASASAICRPLSAPHINGTCTRVSEVGTKCSDKRLSRSNDCKELEFCCFDGFAEQEAQTDIKAQSERMCSPITAPEVLDGKCVSIDNLKQSCSGSEIASSAQCPKAEHQLCCFKRPLSSKTGPVFHAESEVDLRDQLTASENASKQCRPASDVIQTKGLCIPMRQLRDKCQAQVSGSVDCSRGELCCFDRDLPHAEESLSPANKEQSVSTCNPITASEVNDGRCVALSSLKDQCSGLEVASSKNCAGKDQLCCFKRPDSSRSAAVFTSVSVTSTAGCTPLSRPDIKNGQCLPVNEVSIACKGKQLSASNECQKGHFCCFMDESAKRSCSPVSDSSAKNGSCTGLTDLKEQCKAQVSSSADCAGGELCCFARDENTVKSSGVELSTTIIKSCTPSSQPNINNGSCISRSQLASQCGQKRLSRSSDCNDDQLCCFDFESNAVDHKASPSLSCSPLTAPEVDSGRCVGLNDLRDACFGMEISSSSQCASRSLCCFRRPETSKSFLLGLTGNDMDSGSGLKVSPSECTPNSDPELGKGSCTAISLLQDRCTSQISGSRDCSSGELCCFDRKLTSIEIPPVKSVSETVTTTEPTTTQFTTAVATPSSASGVSCTPNSESHLGKVGTCMTVRSLALTCANQRASPSLDCPRFQWCCFGFEEQVSTSQATEQTTEQITEATTAAATTTPTTTTVITDAPTTASISLFNPIKELVPISLAPVNVSCVPELHPSVTDGICMESSELRVKCLNRQVSRAPQCTNGAFCCFTKPTVKVLIPQTPQPQAQPSGSGGCTPNDNPTVNDGQCLRVRDMASQCMNRKAAPSRDCLLGQWCCYGSEDVAVKETLSVAADLLKAPPVEPTTVTTTTTTTTTTASTTTAPVAEEAILPRRNNASNQCAPNRFPNTPKDGSCMTLRQIQQGCTVQAAPSEDCEMGSWCCYDESKLTASNRDVSGSTGLEEADVTTERPAGPSCVPNNNPKLEGLCILTRDLRSRCRNKKVSKAPQCRAGQWCCYDAPEGERSSERLPFDPVPRSLLTGL